MIAALEVTLIEEENAGKSSLEAVTTSSSKVKKVISPGESNLEESEWEGGGQKAERAKREVLKQMDGGSKEGKATQQREK